MRDASTPPDERLMSDLFLFNTDSEINRSASEGLFETKGFTASAIHTFGR
jgi:hypothetical protein